jgi:hypothetical protein
MRAKFINEFERGKENPLDTLDVGRVNERIKKKLLDCITSVVIEAGEDPNTIEENDRDSTYWKGWKSYEIFTPYYYKNRKSRPKDLWVYIFHSDEDGYGVGWYNNYENLPIRCSNIEECKIKLKQIIKRNPYL